MAGRCWTVDATEAHAEELVRNLQDGQIAELMTLNPGFAPEDVIPMLLRLSVFSFTIMCADGVVAMGGLFWRESEAARSPAWFYSTHLARRFWISYAREFRRVASAIVEAGHQMVLSADTRYSDGVRLIRFAGGEIGPPDSRGIAVATVG